MGARILVGTGTYMDGSVIYGPAEFEAEHGMTFTEFSKSLTPPAKPEKKGRLYRDG